MTLASVWIALERRGRLESVKKTHQVPLLSAWQAPPVPFYDDPATP
jgi:hypothetical protein